MFGDDHTAGRLVNAGKSTNKTTPGDGGAQRVISFGDTQVFNPYESCVLTRCGDAVRQPDHRRQQESETP
jgi:hypothetical protein